MPYDYDSYKPPCVYRKLIVIFAAPLFVPALLLGLAKLIGV